MDQDTTSTGASRLHAQVELVGVAASASTPFWMRSNQYGMVPTAGSAASVRVGLSKEYAHPPSLPGVKRRLCLGFGVLAVASQGISKQLVLPEVYVKMKYGVAEFCAGRRRELIGLGDSTLSSGFLIGSGNAVPIPKLQLSTRGYVPLPFLNGFVAVQAAFAHGWFNVPYIQGSFLHQKSVYWRLGRPTARVNAYVGLNHQVQWGGHATYLIDSPLAVNGYLPSAFAYYGHVVLATQPSRWTASDYTDFDGSYRIGNHVGSCDVGLAVNTNRSAWLLYHQHPYEDMSGLAFINVPDGLTGLSWRKKRRGTGLFQLRHVVVEWLSTMNQSGPDFIRPNSRFQGKDNYFNHAQYREGWSYLGQAIGTPFMAPAATLLPAAQTGAFFPSNRVKMGYVGAEANLATHLLLTIRGAYSLHYGTYDRPYDTPIAQFSAYAAARFNLPRWPNTSLTTSLAIDQGGLLPQTSGGSISLRRSW